MRLADDDYERPETLFCYSNDLIIMLKTIYGCEETFYGQ